MITRTLTHLNSILSLTIFFHKKLRFRLLTLRPSSFGLFRVHLQSPAPPKKKRKKKNSHIGSSKSRHAAPRPVLASVQRGMGKSCDAPVIHGSAVLYACTRVPWPRRPADPCRQPQPHTPSIGQLFDSIALAQHVQSKLADWHSDGSRLRRVFGAWRRHQQDHVAKREQAAARWLHREAPEFCTAPAAVESLFERRARRPAAASHRTPPPTCSA